jgi:hypothetical protein
MSLISDDTSIYLNGTEHICTFGGESNDLDFIFDQYGIDFDVGAVYNLTSKQMIALATCIVDHLILNGHRFEIRPTNEQDQLQELIYLSQY